VSKVQLDFRDDKVFKVQQASRVLKALLCREYKVQPEYKVQLDFKDAKVFKVQQASRVLKV
jgi:hypothetical protein